MSSNNLQSLNDTLFETLQGVKNGSIKTTDAKVINELAGTIINNAKVQLEAIKVTKGGRGSDIFGIKGIAAAAEPDDDTYSLKKKYSQELGYDNVAAALKEVGSWAFEQGFKKWKEDQPF